MEVPTEFAKYQNILKFLYYVVSGLKEQYFYSFDVSINIILFFFSMENSLVIIPTYIETGYINEYDMILIYMYGEF